MNESSNVAKVLADKQYVAPKEWDALTDSEKIERMREIVKGYKNEVSRLQADLHRINTAFEKHSHDVQNGGKLTIPYDRYTYGSSNTLGSCEVSSTGKYF